MAVCGVWIVMSGGRCYLKKAVEEEAIRYGRTFGIATGAHYRETTQGGACCTPPIPRFHHSLKSAPLPYSHASSARRMAYCSRGGTALLRDSASSGGAAARVEAAAGRWRWWGDACGLQQRPHGDTPTQNDPHTPNHKHAHTCRVEGRVGSQAAHMAHPVGEGDGADVGHQLRHEQRVLCLGSRQSEGQ